jgi:hypothetical protein
LQNQRGADQKHVRFQSHKLKRIGPYARGIGATPAIVNPRVAAISPPQFFKRLPEDSYIGSRLWVGFGEGAQYANPSGRYLPARRHWPRRRRATQNTKKFPPPHVRTQAQGPALYRLKRAL